MVVSTIARWRSTAIIGPPSLSASPSGALRLITSSLPGPARPIRAEEPSPGTKMWWHWFTQETSASTAGHWDIAPLVTTIATVTSWWRRTKRKREGSGTSMGEEEEEEVEEEQWGGRAGASRSRGHQGALECVAEQEGWIFIDLNTYTHTFMVMSTLRHTHRYTHSHIHLTYTLRQTDRLILYVQRLTCACT